MTTSTIIEPEEDAREQAETEARRRLALAQIRQYGDPALRLIAHDVEDFDDDLRRLVDRMTVLMHEAQGVGLASDPGRRSSPPVRVRAR